MQDDQHRKEDPNEKVKLLELGILLLPLHPCEYLVHDEGQGETARPTPCDNQEKEGRPTEKREEFTFERVEEAAEADSDFSAVMQVGDDAAEHEDVGQHGVQV